MRAAPNSFIFQHDDHDELAPTTTPGEPSTWRRFGIDLADRVIKDTNYLHPKLLKNSQNLMPKMRV
jgi:hypothetical protein